MDIMYDWETYPDVCTCAFHNPLDGWEVCYRVGDDSLFDVFNWVRREGHRLVGFNNLHFDYKLTHQLLLNPRVTAYDIYMVADAIINSGDKWAHFVKREDVIIPQIDLMLLHHLNGKNRGTRLKQIEFALRMNSIMDLPITPGECVGESRVPDLMQYNLHDARATGLFYMKSLDMIKEREELSKITGEDMLSYSNTKVGTTFIVRALEKDNPGCCYGLSGREVQQTERHELHPKEFIFPYVKFVTDEFSKFLNFFNELAIHGDSEVQFDGVVDGLHYTAKLGGLHASVTNADMKSGDGWDIIDVDVKGYYPSLSIANRMYPEHLTERFCDAYADFAKERDRYAKGTAMNKALKEGTNAVYGNSKNDYSCFKDHRYARQTTINGQLLILMLVEQLVISGCKVIQANTDGVTFWQHVIMGDRVRSIMEQWESLTKLILEETVYSRMVIKSISGYIAMDESGDIKKAIGPYSFEKGWHENHSALVIPKAVQQYYKDGGDIEEIVRKWPDAFDFMLCAKAKSMRKVGATRNMWGDHQVQDVTRYYISTSGEPLVIERPPLAKSPNKVRVENYHKDRLTMICNDMSSFDPSMIDYDYYINECRKLII